MSMLFFTGSKLNAFARGTLTINPAAAAVSAAANVCDNDAGCELLYGSIAADSYIQVALNALTNPGFETSTLSGWTAGTVGGGTSAEEAVTVKTGTKSLKLTGSDASNYGSRHQSLTVAAGEFRKATVYIKTLTAGSAKIFLRNLKTGLYYNGSAWAAPRAAAVTQAATGSFAAMTVTYQVEAYETCMDDTVSLRWEVACESGTVFIDDCLDVPGISFASIHGHNLGPVVVPTVRSSDDGSAWTDRSTMTIREPQFYSVFGIIYAEYWRIVLVGTPHATPYIGEAVLGQYQTATTTPEWGLVYAMDIPGSDQVSGTGRKGGYNYSKHAAQSVRMSFEAYTQAAAHEISHGLWLRSGRRLYPMVVALTDTSEVFFGRPGKPFETASPPGAFTYSMDVEGDPFPTVGL